MAAYRQAVARGQSDGEALARLGHLLLIRGEVEKGRAYLRRAGAARPAKAQGCLQLARVLNELGEVAAAETCLRRALVLDPGAAEAQWWLGNLLQQLGRFDDARVCFERAIELQPQAGAAYLDLVAIRKIGADDRALVARMETLLDAADLTERDRVRLHYAIGKAHDDLAEYAAAMRHFDAANSICFGILRRTERAIDRQCHAADIDRMIETFTADFFARHTMLGSSTELPVFIVGMIRSGTTLLEQVLAGHKQIAPGGELRFWGEKGTLLGAAKIGALGPEAGRIAADYLGILRATASSAVRATDKMPTNFLMLGLNDRNQNIT